jgi:hypothetical protein
MPYNVEDKVRGQNFIYQGTTTLTTWSVEKQNIKKKKSKLSNANPNIEKNALSLPSSPPENQRLV